MSLVRLSVSNLALRLLLRLPDARLVAAGTESYGGGDPNAVALILDMPDAPPGAVRVDLLYTRGHGLPDPVTLDSVRWIGADGEEIKARPEGDHPTEDKDLTSDEAAIDQ
jgi:hypothetical protein